MVPVKVYWGPNPRITPGTFLKWIRPSGSLAAALSNKMLEEQNHPVNAFKSTYLGAATENSYIRSN